MKYCLWNHHVNLMYLVCVQNRHFNGFLWTDKICLRHKTTFLQHQKVVLIGTKTEKDWMTSTQLIQMHWEHLMFGVTWQLMEEVGLFFKDEWMEVLTSIAAGQIIKTDLAIWAANSGLGWIRYIDSQKAAKTFWELILETSATIKFTLSTTHSQCRVRRRSTN